VLRCLESSNEGRDTARAMSKENEEVVRGIYDAWLRGEMAFERFDPEIAMVESATLPGAASAYGIDAVRRYMESFANYWDEIRFEPLEYIDASDDRVVVVARLIGRGKTSGASVERTWAYVWTIRAGKALRMEGFTDRASALKAAGLSE
jgi:ketosteroid isomerase-like protein